MSSAFSPDELAVIRRAYAKQILALSGIADDPRLEEALAAVPRERFLGAPPWQISRAGRGYETVASHDPAVLYQDALFALASDKGVNNGSPSLHARCLHALSPREGERVAHIGAGTGYYTALLAHLVGPEGMCSRWSSIPPLRSAPGTIWPTSATSPSSRATAPTGRARMWMPFT